MRVIITVFFCHAALLLFGQPIINTFSPQTGPVGTIVTISGLGFSTTPANNIVYFGFVRGNVTAATSSSLSVAVPYGSAYEPVSVTVNNLTSYTVLPFITTFSGGNGINAATFTGRVSFTVGFNPLGIAIADMEGDGKPDIAAVTAIAQSVSILKNTSTPGTVSFAAKVDLTSGTFPQRVALRDLDGDGKPDLIVASSAANQFLMVHRNTSTGGVISFGSIQQFPIGVSPKGIALGDIDGDGKTDVTVVNHDDRSISVLRNSSTPGSVSFLPKVDYSTGAFNPFGMILQDLDGDGKVDMAVSSYMLTGSATGNIGIFRNTSTAGVMSFATRIDQPAEDGSFEIAAGDLNNDSKPDLVATNRNSLISVYKNLSTTGNISFASRINYTASASQAVCINDLDGDAKPDIAVADYYSQTISVFKNLSAGGNISLQANQSFASANYNSSICSGDVDGDGKAEIITGDEGNASVSVFRNVAGIITATSTTSYYKPSIKMYPNPGSSVLILDSLKISDKWVSLEIADIYGKKIMTNTTIRNRTTVNLTIERLNSGSYFIILINKEGKRSILKFIKG